MWFRLELPLAVRRALHRVTYEVLASLSPTHSVTSVTSYTITALSDCGDYKLGLDVVRASVCPWR